MRETPGLHLERELWQKGIQFIGGIDEAGRGALAGPVSAGVVILPTDEEALRPLAGVRDSKQMTPLQRSRAAIAIQQVAIGWGVGMSSAEEINEMGILPATRQAVLRAIQSLPIVPNYLLMDYISWKGLAHPHQIMHEGENQSLSIAAASVLAKTARDEWMKTLDGQYPGYGFARHKGYGTEFHRLAVSRLGPSPEHRRLFIRKIMMTA